MVIINKHYHHIIINNHHYTITTPTATTEFNHCKQGCQGAWVILSGYAPSCEQKLVSVVASTTFIQSVSGVHYCLTRVFRA